MNQNIPVASGAPMRPQKIDADEIDLRAYLSVIMRRKKVLILTLELPLEV